MDKITCSKIHDVYVRPKQGRNECIYIDFAIAFLYVVYVEMYAISG